MYNIGAQATRFYVALSARSMVAAWNQPGLPLATRVKRLTGFPTRLEYLLAEAQRVCSGCNELRNTVHEPNKENTAVLSPSWCAACWEPYFAEKRQPRLPDSPPHPHRELVPVRAERRAPPSATTRTAQRSRSRSRERADRPQTAHDFANWSCRHCGARQLLGTIFCPHCGVLRGSTGEPDTNATAPRGTHSTRRTTRWRWTGITREETPVLDDTKALVHRALQLISDSLRERGGSGNVWIKNWPEEFEPTLGPLRAFLEAHDRTFKVTPMPYVSKNKYTVTLLKM